MQKQRQLQTAVWPPMLRMASTGTSRSSPMKVMAASTARRSSMTVTMMTLSVMFRAATFVVASFQMDTSETINILNHDGTLELLTKSIPNASVSWLQVKISEGSAR